MIFTCKNEKSHFPGKGQSWKVLRQIFLICINVVYSILSTFCFLAKFSVYRKFLQIFHVVFLSKISVKIFRNLPQLAAPKNLHRKFFCLTEKIWGFKIFWLFTEKFSELKIFLVGLKPGFNLINRKIFCFRAKNFCK